MSNRYEASSHRSVRIRLSRRSRIVPVDGNIEPTRYYFWPIVGWFYRKRLQMVIGRISGRRYRRILEVAYGSGIFLPTLSQCCDEVHGVELHRGEKIVLQNLLSYATNARLTCGSALSLPYADESFDCVVSISMLEHLIDPSEAVNELYRVTQRGGRIALGVPCRNVFMDMFFRLLGYNPRAIHPSSQTDVLNAVRRRSGDVSVCKFPRWLPMGLGIYCVFVVDK